MVQTVSKFAESHLCSDDRQNTGQILSKSDRFQTFVGDGGMTCSWQLTAKTFHFLVFCSRKAGKTVKCHVMMYRQRESWHSYMHYQFDSSSNLTVCLKSVRCRQIFWDMMMCELVTVYHFMWCHPWTRRSSLVNIYQSTLSNPDTFRLFSKYLRVDTVLFPGGCQCSSHVSHLSVQVHTYVCLADPVA